MKRQQTGNAHGGPEIKRQQTGVRPPSAAGIKRPRTASISGSSAATPRQFGQPLGNIEPLLVFSLPLPPPLLLFFHDLSLNMLLFGYRMTGSTVSGASVSKLSRSADGNARLPAPPAKFRPRPSSAIQF
jgi:hypothetical protein